MGKKSGGRGGGGGIGHYGSSNNVGSGQKRDRSPPNDRSFSRGGGGGPGGNFRDNRDRDWGRDDVETRDRDRKRLAREHSPPRGRGDRDGYRERDWEREPGRGRGGRGEGGRGGGDVSRDGGGFRGRERTNSPPRGNSDTYRTAPAVNMRPNDSSATDILSQADKLSHSLSLPLAALDPMLRLSRRIAGDARYDALVARRHPVRVSLRASSASSRARRGSESWAATGSEDLDGEARDQDVEAETVPEAEEQEKEEEAEAEEAAGDDDLYGDDLYGDLGKDDDIMAADDDAGGDESNKDDGKSADGEGGALASSSSLSGRHSSAVINETPTEYSVQNPSFGRQRLLSMAGQGRGFSSLFLETKGRASLFSYVEGL